MLRRAPIARAGSRLTVILPAKVKCLIYAIFFAMLLKLVLCTVREELSAGVNNFLAEVLILGKSHKKS